MVDTQEILEALASKNPIQNSLGYCLFTLRCFEIEKEAGISWRWAEIPKGDEELVIPQGNPIPWDRAQSRYIDQLYDRY